MQEANAISTLSQSQVAEVVSQLTEHTERLERLVSTLEDRLAQVLRPDSPSPEVAEGSPEKVPLAHQLAQLGYRQYLQLNHLSGMLDRLEL